MKSKFNQSLNPQLTRRNFVFGIGISGAAGALTLSPFQIAQAARNFAGPLTLPVNASPIQSISANELISTEFNGDIPERSHEIIWDVENYIRSKGGIPQPSEQTDVVVLGGGISGLYSAYLLRDHKPIVLELDRFFGGNSKGERYGRSLYSIGAAYMMVPDAGSEDEKLLQELGLLNAGRAESSDEMTVFMSGAFKKGFWQGATDPAAADQFERVHAALVAYLANDSAGKIADTELARLDTIPFVQWLTETLGTVHPHVLEYFQLYGWSSFTAPIEELSAYQMLGFVAAETEDIMTFPGGNSAVTYKLHSKLTSELGEDRLRNGCVAIKVDDRGDSLWITYALPDGSLKTVSAKTCVFAAPKYIAKRIIPSLSQEQVKAMSMIRYRGYVVCNLILNRAFKAENFDLYCLEGKVPEAPSALNPSARSFTDVCFGSWAQRDQVDHSVLTIYKPFAFDGDRQFLFNPMAHDKYKKQILKGIEPVLDALGLTSADIIGVRMTRWGHSLPIAATEMISSGILARASQPVGGKIFFANQDNQANPSFETATIEARGAAQGVRKALELF